MNKFIKYLKNLYTASNSKWQLEQQQQTALMQQAQYEYNKQLMTNSSHVFLLFFRPLLNQITYFDTTSMRCDVVGICNNVYRLCLQVPIRVSCQADMPSHKTLIQLIENLIFTECVQQKEQLYNKAYYLQTSCCSPSDVMRYNKAIEDHICCFMQYRAGIHSLNSFKAVLLLECVLDSQTMQTAIKRATNKHKLKNKDNFIFTHEDGRRYTTHDFSCAVDRRASEAGIKKTSIHGIRRTVSSQLNTILSQKAVADMLGHSERVNEQHYNYSTAENTEKAAALKEVSSNVINFRHYLESKKTAEAL